MIKNTLDKPYVLMIDDDEEFNKIIRQRLDEMNLDYKVVTSSKSFISEMNHRKPNLCLVDLNLEHEGVGLKIVKAIRNKIGNSPPIAIVSSRYDPKTIENAIELGANDYIIKPPSKQLFCQKILKLIDQDASPWFAMSFRKVPMPYQQADLSIRVKITEVSEKGFTVISPHLLSKGKPFKLDGDLIHQITGKPEINLKVVDQWSTSQQNLYGAFLSFSASNQEPLSHRVRCWIKQQKR